MRAYANKDIFKNLKVCVVIKLLTIQSSNSSIKLTTVLYFSKNLKPLSVKEINLSFL
jgi:hypothetical protein